MPGGAGRNFAAAIGLACAHFVLAFGGLELSQLSTGLAAIWPANAVLLAYLLRTTRDRWPLACLFVGIASAAANMLGHNGTLPSILFAIANIVEGLIVVGLIQRVTHQDFDVERPVQLWYFIGAAIVATAASATIAAATFALLTDQDPRMAWQSWFSSDLLGLLVTTPILLVLSKRRTAAELFRTSAGEAVAILALTVVVSLFVFMQTIRPLLFLVPPTVLLAAFRLRATGATVATMFVATVGTWFTVIGSGPIDLYPASPAEHLLLLQIFLAVSFLGALPIAAVLDERDRLSLAANEARQRAERIAAEALRLAATDELTGLPSRREFLARLDTAVTGWNDWQHPFAVAIFDIDFFKLVNDRHGHAVGDAVLRAVAGAAEQSVRGGDVIGRLGGEEFGIILTGASVDQARGVGERLRIACSEIGESLDGVNVTVSVGIAVAGGDANSELLLRDADRALYRAKAEGRNCLRFAA